jgi:phospholipase/carboxylesterase
MRVVARPAARQAEGALVLLHGRDAGERQLESLLDRLDPERRLLGLVPRALHAGERGRRWYELDPGGAPERSTFLASVRLLASWLDGLSFPPRRIVLGGFSQGAVLSYALALGAGRTRPAGVIALSGYLPAVAGWEIDLAATLPSFAIGHGALDEVVPVERAREARARLEGAGAEVLYHESPLGHAIDRAFLAEAAVWLGRLLAVLRPGA